MTITPEQLAAFADGELPPDEALRVEQAIAADPALAAMLDQHLTLKSALSAHFAPIAAAPLPDRMTSLLRAPSNVVPLRPAPHSRKARSMRWGWIVAPALAAALALAVFIPRNGTEVTYADAQLATVLDRQLSSEQSADAATRVLLSFERQNGDYCRAYASVDQSGIACRDGTGWAIVERMDGIATSASEYQQAGSPMAALMEKAQDMAPAGALDSAGEREARARSWQD